MSSDFKSPFNVIYVILIDSLVSPFLYLNTALFLMLFWVLKNYFPPSSYQYEVSEQSLNNLFYNNNW